MKLIAGLGNPGKEYEKTRHNVGFMVLDKLTENYGVSWEADKKTKSLKASIKIGDNSVVLVKPQAFMNNSGHAVSLISRYRNISISDLWVIHDDLDLPLGKIRIQIGGEAAGHHGVESIIEALGTKEFTRVRMGVSGESSRLKAPRPRQGGAEGGQGLKRAGEDYVLGEFRKDERPAAEEMINLAAEAIQFALNEGIEKAMGKFNG